MTGQRLHFRPQGTLLLSCAIPLVYDCTDPPKIGDVKTELGTFPTFGILLTHEYVVHQARIESVEPREVVLPNCSAAKAYDVAIHYWLSHKLKMTLGKSVVLWSSPRAREYWRLERADSVCCDPDYESPSLAEQKAHLHAGAFIGICVATTAPGGALAGLHDYSPLQTGQSLIVSVAVVCGAVVALRLFCPWLTDMWRRISKQLSYS